MARLSREPRWVAAGDPNDQSYLDRAACHDHTDLFFSADPSDAWEARRICFGCPVFEPCARYWLNHYEDMEDGIVFGLSASERRAIDESRKRFVDWRRFWTREKYVTRRTDAIRREQKRKGISKRQLQQAEMPECPRGHRDRVNRCGFDHDRNQQRYVCLTCGYRFLEEEAA